MLDLIDRCHGDEFPARFEKFPILLQKTPFSLAPGISGEHSKFALKVALIFGSRLANSRNSLFFPIADEIIVKDSNGAKVADGDAVTLIKDLIVKGTCETLMGCVLVKNIRLVGNSDEAEFGAKRARGIVLRTEFLKKIAFSCLRPSKLRRILLS